MLRSRFLLSSAGAALASALPLRARATGGLDIGDEPAAHVVRILLASGSFPEPRQLDAWHFSWNGGTFRGTTSSERLTDGRPGLINTLPLDAYLYGVLSVEISPAWPTESQAAQAIVARTYALGRLRPEHQYDMTAGTAAQAYHGIESEAPQGRQAVDATAGTIVTFNDTPADVAYSACCGGHTADPVDVWPGARDLPYLAGVADPNCVGTPGYRWSDSVALGSLGSLCDAEKLRSIELRDQDASGRPRNIALVGKGTQIVDAGEFRRVTGVPSTFIASAELDTHGNQVHLTGFGRGHGVGFCQWGARGAGLRGMAAADIVQFYFPGTALGRA